MKDVLIKWTGSKRLQAKQIISSFPKKINTYFEPFLGGGSIFLSLIKSKAEINCYVCSDTNQELIGIWNIVKNNHLELCEHYKENWLTLKEKGESHYLMIRERFNSNKNPLDLFFLIRTCRNGLIRYNKKGCFNSAFHHRRLGASPDKVSNCIADHNALISRNNVIFETRSFETICSQFGDFVYADPPYQQAKDKFYYGGFQVYLLWDWLKSQHGSWALSLNGIRDNKDCTIDVPDIYDDHFLINTNSFQRLTKSKSLVQDSLYVKTALVSL